MAKTKQEKKIKTTEKSSTKSVSDKGELWYVWLILGFSFLLYSNAIFNGYNMDDELVTQNHRLTSKGISAIPEIFSSPYYEDEQGYKYEYRPIVLVTFAIEHSLFGDQPNVGHFINVLLYGVLCLLLFIVLRNLLKQYSQLFPLVVVLLFIAHPIHTEVVASIKNRDEILCLIFGLLSLHFSLRFVEDETVKWFLLVPIFFFLGVLTKSTIITFALLIPLSLLMFTHSSFNQMMAITGSLVLPAVFYSRLYSVGQQILLVMALFVSVAVLYSMRHGYLSYEKIVRFAREKYTGIVIRTEPEVKSSMVLNFEFLKNKLVLLSTILLIVVLTLFSLYGLSLRDPWFSVIPSLIFAVVFVRVREELKLIFITPLTIIALYSFTKFSFAATLIEAGFVVFIANQLLSENKWFKILAGINCAAYIVFSVVVLHSAFFLNVFFFAGFFNRRLLPLTILVAAYSFYHFGKHIYFLMNGIKEFNLAYLGLPVIFAGVFMLWSKRQHLFRWASVISIPMFIAFCYTTALPDADTNVIQGLKKNYDKINTVKAADMTPVQTVRPFGYMESPVTVSDPWDIKLGTAMIVLGNYLKLVVVPYPMSYYYGFAYIVPTKLLQAIPLLVLLIHLALLILAVFALRKIPFLSYAILFYLVGVSIFSGLVSTVPGMMGDRFLFIPSIGFCFLVAFAAFKIFKQDFSNPKLNFENIRFPLKVSLSVVLAVYSLGTFSRNFDWKDRLTLFRKDINAVENSAQAHNLLGVHLMIESAKETDANKQRTMREEAVIHFKRAVEIYPKFLNASFDLGRAYLVLQQNENAYSTWEQTRTIDTNFVLPCYMMAVIQQNKGHLKKATELYEVFLTKYPTDLQALGNLSYAYFGLGEYQKSLDTKKRALTFNPGNFEFLSSVAQTYLQMNIKDSSLVYFERALMFNPSDQFVIQKIQELKSGK